MAYCSSYYLYQRYEKRGDQDWIPSYPNVYSIDGEGSKPLRARQMYDTDCGWIPDTEVQNRTLSGTPYCTGYDLYVNKTYQVSYDGGITWETTGNEDALVERNSADCGYVPPPPMYRWVNVTPTSDPNSYWCEECSSGYSNQYLTFVAIDSGTFSFSGTSSSTIDNSSIEYSLDSGSTWTTLNRNVASPTVTAGSKIMWKATFLSDYGVGIGRFNATGRYNIEGNIMSLLYGSNFVNNNSLSGYDHAFTGLFRGTSVVSAANLILPARTLRLYCYSTMFYGCSLLTSAPALPATTAADECYQSMFQNCTSLTTAPDLNTTNMGWGSCSWMFAGCTALTTPPALPATTMYDYCYQYMFSGCTSLATSPTLPASTLVYMCYDRMFYGCRNLNYVRCYANTIAESSTIEWLYNVKSTGTFVKSPTMNSWERGNSGIPTNWTVQNP